MVVLLSLMSRIIYFTQLNNTPCLVQHRWPQSDMNFFDQWARQIAAGDILSEHVGHPLHNWHQDVARQYWHLYPEHRPRANTQSSEKKAARALWQRWYGPKQFHQAPLYPYLVGLTYRIFGVDVRWVFAWQMILGTLSNVLIYLIARRWFGQRVAVLAALGAVLCGPLLFYEMILLRTTLINFLGLVLVYLGAAAFQHKSWPRWFVTGIIFGLALLTKSSFALLFFGIVAGLFYHYRRRPRRLARYLAALGIGTILPLTPAFARNLVLGTSPVQLSSVAAITFLCSNSEDYPPDLGFYVSRHAGAIMGQTNGALGATAIQTLKTHSSVALYFRLLGRKCATAYHWYEVPNNASFYYYQLHAPILHYLPVRFSWVGPLALLGMIFALGRIGKNFLLYLLVITSLASLILFYVLSRFRLPLLAASLPFGALAAAKLVQWIIARKLLGVMLSLGGLIPLYLFILRPLPGYVPLIRTVDYAVSYDYYYSPLAQQALEKKDFSGAAEILRAALQIEPANLGDLPPQQSSSRPTPPALMLLLAGMHRDYAQVVQKMGHFTEAQTHREKARRLNEAASQFY